MVLLRLAGRTYFASWVDLGGIPFWFVGQVDLVTSELCVGFS